MAYRTENFSAWVPYIEKLPLGQHFDVSIDGKELQMQASGEQVAKVRACFPGLIWTKKPSDIGWWEYETDVPIGKLRIYADRIGPKSCKRIEEEVSEIVHVPACEAHDEVRRVKKVRWECPEED